MVGRGRGITDVEVPLKPQRGVIMSSQPLDCHSQGGCCPCGEARVREVAKGLRRRRAQGGSRRDSDQRTDKRLQRWGLRGISQPLLCDKPPKCTVA